MKKLLLFGASFVLVILVAVLGYQYLRYDVANMPYIPGMVRAVDTGSIVEDAAYYDIVVKYATTTPLLTSAGREADAAAVKRMKDFITKEIAQFKEYGDFDNLTPEDIKIMGFDQGRKQTLTINHLTATSPRSVSYLFNIYRDTLGAHGNTYYRTFTFDLSNGNQLALADLFVPGAPYLDTLSSISRGKLPEIIENGLADIGMIADGTRPEAKSFENFFLDGNSLVLLFPPYAVAPYAAGSQTLAIPLTELKTILKPEYQ